MSSSSSLVKSKAAPVKETTLVTEGTVLLTQGENLLDNLTPETLSIIQPRYKSSVKTFIESLKDELFRQNSADTITKFKTLDEIMPVYINKYKNNKDLKLLLDYIEDVRNNTVKQNLHKYIKNKMLLRGLTTILGASENLYRRIGQQKQQSGHMIKGGKIETIIPPDSSNITYYTIIGFINYEHMTKPQDKLLALFKFSMDHHNREKIKGIYARNRASMDEIDKHCKYFFEVLIQKTDSDKFDKEFLITNFKHDKLMAILKEKLATKIIKPQKLLLPTSINDIPFDIDMTMEQWLIKARDLMLSNISQIIQRNNNEALLELEGDIYFFNVDSNHNVLNTYGNIASVLKYNYRNDQIMELISTRINCNDLLLTMAKKGFDAPHFFGLLESENSNYLRNIENSKFQYVKNESLFPKPGGGRFNIRLHEIDDVDTSESDLLGGDSSYKQTGGTIWKLINYDSINFFKGNFDSIVKLTSTSKWWIPGDIDYRNQDPWNRSNKSMTLSEISRVLNEDLNIQNTNFDVFTSGMKKVSEEIEAKGKNYDEPLLAILNKKLGIVYNEIQQKNKEGEESRKQCGLVVFCVFVMLGIGLALQVYANADTGVKLAIMVVAGVAMSIVSIFITMAQPVFVTFGANIASLYDKARVALGWTWIPGIPGVASSFEATTTETELLSLRQQVERGEIGKETAKKIIRKLEGVDVFQLLKTVLNELKTTRTIVVGGSTRVTKKKRKQSHKNNRYKKNRRTFRNIKSMKSHYLKASNKKMVGGGDVKFLLNEIINSVLSTLQIIFFPENYSITNNASIIDLIKEIWGKTKIPVSNHQVEIVN